MYSYSDCVTEIPNNYCDNCPSPELGGIGGFALVRHDAYDTLAADPTNPSLWQDLIDANDGSIYIFPNTQGSFDGGTAKTGQGWGRVAIRRQASEYKLNIRDLNYILNAPFWDAVQDSYNYHPVFLTETQAHIADKPSAIVPKAPITQEWDSEVVWEAEMSWIGKRYPVPFDIPAGIFVCS
jgi:hypothetical protein